MSEHFKDLTEKVDRAHSRATSVESLARSARDALSQHIGHGDFLMDCVEGIVNSVASANPCMSWDATALYANEELHYQFKVFFWAPGFISAPHQHNTWGVTGVLHNQSSVVLYGNEGEPEPGKERLVAGRQFLAGAGEVGYLVPPCTHSVANPGASISATFHIFSVSADEEQRPNDTVWYPNPRASIPDKPPRYYALRGSAEILARIHDTRSVRLLERIFLLGGPYVRLICVKAMAAIDLQEAASRGEEFRASLPAELHGQLDTVLSAGELEVPVY